MSTGEAPDRSGTASGADDDPAAAPHGDRRGALVLLVVCTAVLLDALDLSITQVALPEIRTSLNLSATAVQWVVNAYVLTYAGFLLLGGRLADLTGLKRIFLLGMALFGVMSLVGGVAPNATVIILARAAQGVGAALTVPASVAIIATTFEEGTERNRAFGFFAAAASAGFAAGLVLGGVLTELLSWRWIFFIKVPIVFVILLFAIFVVAEHRSDDTRLRRYDLPGAVLGTIGLLLLVFTITQLADRTLAVPLVAVSGVVAIALLVGFVVNEGRTEDPLLPLSTFRLHTLRNADIASLTVLAAPFGYSFVVTLYTQEVLQYTPLQTGLALLPAGVLSALVARYMAPILIRRYGLRVAGVTGLGLVALGFVMLVGLSEDSAYVTVLLPSSLICLGLGMGNAYPTFAIGGVTGISDGQQGLAAGVQQTALQFGGGLGLALVASAVAASLGTATAANAYVDALRIGALVGSAIPLIGAVFALVGLRPERVVVEPPSMD